MAAQQTKIFFLAGLVGALGAALWAYRQNANQKVFVRLKNSDVYISSQLRSSDFEELKRKQIASVVDIRPDGEARDQLSSAAAAAEAQRCGIEFHYVPVPHGDIPAGAVEKLSGVLNSAHRPILLYCRTGRRAVRTYCLAEASRENGATALQLSEMAHQTGFTIEDLSDEIKRRVGSRSRR
jgi:uncharacterized protein (TIGR01244 family)